MNMILLGAPGAGKGTQSAKISEKYHIPAIATGDILRSAMKNETELGKAAKSYVEAGKLVPDEVVIGIIKEYLSTDACKNGFILDGFPRSIPQAEALDAMGVRIDVVLNIEVEDEKIVERMSGRRVCSCGASYHVTHNPPKKRGFVTSAERLFMSEPMTPQKPLRTDSQPSMRRPSRSRSITPRRAIS